MLERVGELEKYKKEEEKERRKEETQKKKDFAASKKKVQREIQSTTKDVRKGEKEATKLDGQVRKLEKQISDSFEKKSKTEEKFDEVIEVKATKQRELEKQLSIKMEETGKAGGRLAHLEFAQKMLEAGVIVSTDPADSVNGSFSMVNKSLSEKESTSVGKTELSKEDAEEIELLRDEVGRLTEDNNALCAKLEANFRMIKAQEQRIESMAQTLEVQQTTLVAVESQLQADGFKLKDSSRTQTEGLSGRQYLYGANQSSSLQNLQGGASSPNQPGMPGSPRTQGMRVVYAGSATPVAAPAFQPTYLPQDGLQMNSAIRMGSAPQLTTMTRVGREFSPSRVPVGYSGTAYSGAVTPPMGAPMARSLGFPGGVASPSAPPPGYSAGGYASYQGMVPTQYNGTSKALGYSYSGAPAGDGKEGLGAPVSIGPQAQSTLKPQYSGPSGAQALGTRSTRFGTQSSPQSYASAVQPNSQFQSSSAPGGGTNEISTQTSRRGSYMNSTPNAEKSTGHGAHTFAQAVHKMTAQALREYREHENA